MKVSEMIREGNASSVEAIEAKTSEIEKKYALNKLAAALQRMNISWKHEKGSFLFDRKHVSKAAEFLYGALRQARISLVKEQDL